ncbi:hypothetical protein niasHT_000032 [Heterodera trifolii]|uniref:mRNA-decapping enzyme-like protein n=1 Tax=Heterodera trifolii TaxID=157864 RepID=A0ABD2M8N3_9BILA
MSSNLDNNLENIRRIDQFASKVIEHCTHAALFNFSTEQNKWLKTEVDGPLFIYERLDHPLYSMIVVNRNSPQNYVVPITDGLQLRYEPPYIFVHREDGCIRGLWVFGEDECKRVFDTLTKLSMELKMKSAGAITSSPKNSISNNDSGAVAAFAAATPTTKIVAAVKPPPPSQQQQAIRVSSTNTITTWSSQFNNTKQYTNSGTSSNKTTTTIGRDMAATKAATIAAVKGDDSNNNNKSSNIVKPYINTNSGKCTTTVGRDVAATMATTIVAGGIGYGDCSAILAKNGKCTTTVGRGIAVVPVKDDNRDDSNNIKSSNIVKPYINTNSGKCTTAVGRGIGAANVASIKPPHIVMSSNLDNNLENIRRIDQFASKVIEHCTHAALFNFSTEQNKFLKTEVDGPLFIYKRLDHPLYSMIVVSRNSPQNFVEPITDGLQLSYEPPYIFVHREDGCIRGLWVFGEDECKRVFDTLTKLSMVQKMISAGATTSSPKNSINNNDSGAVAAFAAATPPPMKIVAAAKPSTPPPSQQQQQQAIRVSSITATIRGSHTNSNKGHHVGGMTSTLVNCWDASACHCDLEITDKFLTVLYREGAGYRSVFAKHPIFFSGKKPCIFYFEISIIDLHERLLMGFTTKKKGKICERDALFLLSSRGRHRRNGIVSRHEKSVFSIGDVVGCAINFESKQFLSTKNGAILGY